MNIAIEYHYQTPSRLIITPRKPALKHQLLLPTSGLVLVRIGRLDYTITPGQGFWIPQSCLHSVTLLPGTEVHQVSFSLRVRASFPRQAGHFTASALLTALLDKAKQLQNLGEPKYVAMLNDLLKVVKNEATLFTPALESSPLSEIVQHWQRHDLASNTVRPPAQVWPLEASDQQGVEALLFAIRVREARRQQLSGLKDTQIKEALFPHLSQTLADIIHPWFE